MPSADHWLATFSQRTNANWREARILIFDA